MLLLSGEIGGELLSRFIYVFAAQVSFTALTNAVHTLDVRFARWLLMCRDRVATDEMEVTHEYIALMLGVRRASVTIALRKLEGERLIFSKRATVAMRDREGMRERRLGKSGQRG